jgi:hypothetical protein
VHATIKNFKIDVLSLSITVHPKNDKVDSLCDILQVPNDAPLAWLSHNWSMKQLYRINTIP